MGMLAGEGTFCGRGDAGDSDWCLINSAVPGGLEGIKATPGAMPVHK